MRAAVLAIAVACLVAAVAGASVKELGPFLTAETSVTGTVNLYYVGEAGAGVAFFERIGPERVPLGDATTNADGYAVLVPATTWRCDRLVRRFEATAADPDGQAREFAFDIRTPRCRDRRRVRAPRRVAAGEPLPVTVRDLWRLGDVRARLCLRRAGGTPRCREIHVPAGQRRAALRLRDLRRGQWRIRVRHSGYRTQRWAAVGVRPRARVTRPLPHLLATGDSTIEGIESALGEELAGRARVAREFHVGTGLTRPGRPTWRERAADQVGRYRQRLTVISLGAVDFHPIAGHECCDEAWEAGYARRARRLLRVYRQDGRGRVLWLTLPAARHPDFAEIARAVNSAVMQAARGRSWVRLVRLDEIFTPAGRFRARMPYRGRTVTVRSADGVHLTAIGTEIAARAAANTLKAWPGALR